MLAGTRVAIAGGMHRHLRQIVHEVCSCIDTVAADLERDRPRLARALRSESHALRARAGMSAPRPRPRASAGPRALPRLLYQALDEGLIDARQFDRIRLRAGRRR